MLKSRSLKLLLISVVMMVCMSSMVFATNSVPTLSDPNATSGSTTNSIPTIGGNTTTTNGTNNSVSAPSLTTGNTNANTNKSNTNMTVYNNTTTKSTNLPKTGADYSVLFVIALFAVVAVYAYAKIRKYNNIKY